MNIEDLHSAIDAAQELKQDDGNRTHLGASVIGGDCPRSVWYSFRWTKNVKHKAKSLRIFDHGHSTEERVVRMLQDAHGIQLMTHTANKKQLRFQEGHYGGGCDGLVFIAGRGVGVIEIKSHKAKRFAELTKHKDLRAAHLSHFVQCQQYMMKFNLPFCLYVALNKDEDDLYIEYVLPDAAVQIEYSERAHAIIDSDEIPLKINPSPGWYQCKFCDFSDVCHKQAQPSVNCRTCAHATAAKSGVWTCALHETVRTPDEQRAGCAQHVFIPHLVTVATFIEGTADGRGANYTTPKGNKVQNHPDSVDSDQMWEIVRIADAS